MATKSKTKKVVKKKPAVKAVAPTPAKMEVGGMALKGDGKKCCLGLCSSCTSCCVCNMSLENQIRVIFGLLVLILTILGHFVDEIFFSLTGVVGLVYAITGWTNKCWLRCALKKVPCNQGKCKEDCATK